MAEKLQPMTAKSIAENTDEFGILHWENIDIPGLTLENGELKITHIDADGTRSTETLKCRHKINDAEGRLIQETINLYGPVHISNDDIKWLTEGNSRIAASSREVTVSDATVADKMIDDIISDVEGMNLSSGNRIVVILVINPEAHMLRVSIFNRLANAPLPDGVDLIWGLHYDESLSTDTIKSVIITASN